MNGIKKVKFCRFDGSQPGRVPFCAGGFAEVAMICNMGGFLKPDAF